MVKSSLFELLTVASHRAVAALLRSSSELLPRRPPSPWLTAGDGTLCGETGACQRRVTTVHSGEVDSDFECSFDADGSNARGVTHVATHTLLDTEFERISLLLRLLRAQLLLELKEQT